MFSSLETKPRLSQMILANTTLGSSSNLYFLEHLMNSNSFNSIDYE